MDTENRSFSNFYVLLEQLNSAVFDCNLTEYERLLQEMCNHKDEDVALILAKVIYDNLSTYNADYLAKLLEIAIQKRMSWAQIGTKDNPLFKACIVLGSKDLYDCYIEETSPLDNDWYATLYNEAILLDEQIMNVLHPVKKGIHYNGCLKTDDNSSSMVQIHRKDYNFIEDVVLKYNGIIERKQIIKDLLDRSIKG